MNTVNTLQNPGMVAPESYRLQITVRYLRPRPLLSTRSLRSLVSTPTYSCRLVTLPESSVSSLSCTPGHCHVSLHSTIRSTRLPVWGVGQYTDGEDERHRRTRLVRPYLCPTRLCLEETRFLQDPESLRNNTNYERDRVVHQ